MTGAAVKQAREAARISQNSLAKIMGTNQPKIWRIETGQQDPDAEFIRQFAAAIKQISEQRQAEMAQAIQQAQAAA